MNDHPKYPHRDRMIEPLLEVICRLGGRINVRRQGDEVENSLADRFNLSKEAREFSDPKTYNSKGHRAWRNHIQWVRVDLVDRGYLDNSKHGIWAMLPHGFARIGKPAPDWSLELDSKRPLRS